MLSQPNPMPVAQVNARLHDKLLPNLDGIRACACLLVVMTHMPLPMSAEIIGPTGVGIFFVLSGFLMGHLYGGRAWTFLDAIRYGIARFSRIAPIYWVVISLCIGLSWVLPGDFSMRISGATQILRHYLFGGSVSIFWSIGPEVQYYIFFLFVWWALASRLRSQVALPLLGLVCAAMLLTHAWWPGLALPNKLHFFLAGTLAGLAPRPTMATRESQLGLSGLQVLAILVLLSPHALYASKEAFYDSTELALALAVAVYVLSFSTPWTACIFANPVMRRLGQASFSIYLLHVLVFYFGMRWLNLDHRVYEPRWALLAVAGVGVPMLVSRWVEIPLQKVARQRLESLVLIVFKNKSH